MKNFCSGLIIAAVLSQTFVKTVKSFIAKDDAYHLMSTTKGTPAYWKKFLYEVLAMIKQLGLAKFFITLSYADFN